MQSSHTSQLVRKLEKGLYCLKQQEVFILLLPVAVHRQTCTDLFDSLSVWLQTTP